MISTGVTQVWSLSLATLLSLGSLLKQQQHRARALHAAREEASQPSPSPRYCPFLCTATEEGLGGGGGALVVCAFVVLQGRGQGAWGIGSWGFSS
jgi:hypothetical protein